MKAREQDSAVMEDNGTASGHLEVLSIMVRIYEYPWLEGRGLTMSRWTWNRNPGNKRFHVGLNLTTLLTPEADVLGQPGPHKS